MASIHVVTSRLAFNYSAVESNFNLFKVIMATNRIDSLDPALIRPGRIDRKIEFPLPDVKTKRRIFSIHTNRMTLSDDVSLEEYINSKEELSGADIKVFLRLHTFLIYFFDTLGHLREFSTSLK